MTNRSLEDLAAMSRRRFCIFTASLIFPTSLLLLVVLSPVYKYMFLFACM